MSADIQGRRAASWLCRTEDERGRLVDMSERLRRAEIVAIGGFGALGLVAIPTTGWGLVAASGVGTTVFALVIGRLRRSRRPEHLSVAVVATAEVVVAGGILLSVGPRMLLLTLLAGPMLIGAAIWPGRGVAAGTSATALLTVAVAFAVNASAVEHTPALVTVPLTVLVSIAIIASAARAADVDSRATAAIDRLTGLQNRAALVPRAAELAVQAQFTGEPVALILGDLDRFKDVNDSHGHATGDAALVEVARRLRDALGSGGLLYRFGGEELVVLAPGSDLADATRLAEVLRRALAGEPICDLRLTISFGVAVSRPGERFALEELFARADAALYDAKSQGRNRVCSTDDEAGRGAAMSAPQAPVAAAAQGGPVPRARIDRRASRSAHAAAHAANVLGPHSGAPGAGPSRLPSAPSPTRLLAFDDLARTHMLDLVDRLRKIRVVGYAIIFAGLLVNGPYFGWWLLLPPFAGLVLVSAVVVSADRLRRPEAWLAGALALCFLANAGAFLLARRDPAFALPLVLPPFFAWVPAFPRRAVLLGAALMAALIVGVGFAVSPHGVLPNPLIVGVPLCMLLAVSAIGSALGRSTSDHRGAAVIDQLTGMLNRLALEARVAALAHESIYSGEPVALIVGDIDHFKSVNDRDGHAAGDAVLRDVAYRMRTCLRAFEGAYRIGGEEFVVLLSGVDVAAATEIAERIRGAIRSEPVQGKEVTMSFGVAASRPGEPFDYRRLFAAADASLYEAKRSGRDRVSVAASLPAGGAAQNGPLDGSGDASNDVPGGTSNGAAGGTRPVASANL